tara:strand:- start:378 stop:890 length:513 start_codon:yes stop_codon:yes gene_type:complete
MVNTVMYSSKNPNWETPDEVLEIVQSYRPIRLDPCTTAENPTSALEWHTPENDGLSQDWEMEKGGLIYINPPYGRAISKWVGKAVEESVRRPYTQAIGAEIIMLLPARTDTSYWQYGIFESANAICFVRGRIKFKGAKSGAPFPSAFVYFGDREGVFAKHFRAIGQCVTL